MADFLSDQWVEELKNLGSKLPKVQGASISCQYEISGTPEGKIRYYIVWKEGSVSEASKGKLDNPECRFTAKYDDIREIFFGRINQIIYCHTISNYFSLWLKNAMPTMI